MRARYRPVYLFYYCRGKRNITFCKCSGFLYVCYCTPRSSGYRQWRIFVYKSIRVLISAWHNVSQRSQGYIRLNRSTCLGGKCTYALTIHLPYRKVYVRFGSLSAIEKSVYLRFGSLSTIEKGVLTLWKSTGHGEKCTYALEVYLP